MRRLAGGRFSKFVSSGVIHRHLPNQREAGIFAGFFCTMAVVRVQMRNATRGLFYARNFR